MTVAWLCVHPALRLQAAVIGSGSMHQQYVLYVLVHGAVWCGGLRAQAYASAAAAIAAIAAAATTTAAAAVQAWASTSRTSALWCTTASPRAWRGEQAAAAVQSHIARMLPALTNPSQRIKAVGPKRACPSTGKHRSIAATALVLTDLLMHCCGCCGCCHCCCTLLLLLLLSLPTPAGITRRQGVPGVTGCLPAVCCSTPMVTPSRRDTCCSRVHRCMGGGR